METGRRELQARWGGWRHGAGIGVKRQRWRAWWRLGRRTTRPARGGQRGVGWEGLKGRRAGDGSKGRGEGRRRWGSGGRVRTEHERQGIRQREFRGGAGLANGHLVPQVHSPHAAAAAAPAPLPGILHDTSAGTGPHRSRDPTRSNPEPSLPQYRPIPPTKMEHGRQGIWQREELGAMTWGSGEAGGPVVWSSARAGGSAMTK